jgi:hypothetical protein
MRADASASPSALQRHLIYCDLLVLTSGFFPLLGNI